MVIEATGTSTAEHKPSVRADFQNTSAAYAGPIDDPHPLYAELRRTSPVMRGDFLARFGMVGQAGVEGPGRPIYTLFKYDDVSMVLRDSETYTSSVIAQTLGAFLGRSLITTMDGARHRLMRNLLAPAFSPKAAREMRDNIITPVAKNEFVDILRPRKRAELMSEIMLPYPLVAIYRVIGFVHDPEMIEKFAAWGMRILLGQSGEPAKVEAAFKAAQDLYDHLMVQVRERRTKGSDGNDLIGHLLRASYDGHSLSDEEVTEVLRQLLPAAGETTTRSLGSTVVHLLRNPHLLDRVRRDRSLVPHAVNEGMRLDPAGQYVPRQAAKDVEIRGVKIPQGAVLHLALGSANRDEDYFPNGDTFDLDRPARPTLGFGYGPHLCMGMPIAKLEMEVMLNAMLDGFPNLRMDPDAPPPVIRNMQFRGPDAIPVIWD